MFIMSNYQRILVAVDGSKGAHIALEHAIEIVKRNPQAHLDILRVIDINALEYGGAGIALDGAKVYELEQANEQYMFDLNTQLVEQYHLDAAKVHVHLRFGNPKTVIVHDFQPEYQNDLLIVGSTGKNFIQRMVVGSVAAYVIQNAGCDVLVAKFE